MVPNLNFIWRQKRTSPWSEFAAAVEGEEKKIFKLLYDRSLKVLVFHCNGDIEEHINISIGG